MRFLVCLLLAVTMAWCGLHIAEPADLHATPTVVASIDHPSSGEHEAPGQPAHASHHHCPVAPDQQVAVGDVTRCQSRMQMFVTAPDRLASLSHAPPLQPPSA